MGGFGRKERRQEKAEETYGIDGHGGVDNVVVESAIVVCANTLQGWERTGWWVDEGCVAEGFVTAGHIALVHAVHE